MKLVKQVGEFDCGVACVAMLAEVSYGAAYDRVYAERDPDRTVTADLIKALLSFGATPAGTRLTPLPGDGAFRKSYPISLPANALLKVVRSNHEKGNWHWAVWNAESQSILDPEWPASRYRYKVTSYLTVAPPASLAAHGRGGA